MDAPRLIAVLPCYSLDDIAKNLDELTCQEFHACWTALWHPGLLAKTNALPEWKRADQGSLDLEKGLVVCPASASASIDTPLTERLETQGCQLVFGEADRAKTLEHIDRLFDGQLLKIPGDAFPSEPSASVETPELDLTGSPKHPVALADFYALGFAYLMLQALTRKVHYSTNLDVVLMADQAKSAAIAYLSNDSAECERWLQSCFDQLSQERDRYFTQSANLLDLTLLVPSTIGSSLFKQLESRHPQNILATASLLQEIQTGHPDTWQRLTEQHSAHRLGIVGGLLRERLHPWFPLGTLQRDLIRGHAAYQALQISPPKVFSRFDAGMSVEMPTHLRSAGYIGVLLHAFSNGSYPVTSQAKTAWEGSDTTSIDTIGSAVLDAASYRAVFSAINELAKQFDHHQVPTLTCAHWPERTSVAFDDLLRASRRTNAFGEWKTFEDYFETTGYVSSNETFTSSKFRFPLPETFADFSARSFQLQKTLRETVALESTRSMAVIVEQILKSLPNQDVQLAEILEIQRQIEHSLYECDDQSDSVATIGKPSNASVIASLRNKTAAQLALLLPRAKGNTLTGKAWLTINPFSGARRCFLKNLPGSYWKTEDNRIYEAIPNDDVTDLAIDVPPMGVARLSEAAVSSDVPLNQSGRRRGPNLASSNLLLANEFIECQIDPKNGYLRSIMISKKRGGRLSGMPAITAIDPNSSKKPLYSTIENARSSIVTNTPLHSEIESKGDLVLERKVVAQFQLNFGLWRGARSLDVRLKIEIPDYQADATGGLWNHVPIWRTAWPSQAASISTWIQGSKTKMGTAQIFAPEFIEIDDAEHRIYLAFAGLAMHRRVDITFLDTLLPIDINGVCDHRWQIAVDWPRPYQSYLESLDEAWLIEDKLGALREGSSLWFAQTNVPNVRIVPLPCNDRLRLVLHETMGKEGRAKLSFFRDASSAARVDCQGNTIEELQIENGQVIVELKPNEISYIDVNSIFAPK